MVLDQYGGPTHDDTSCNSPIIANNADQNITFNPAYYYMGQISKFLPPGSIRIGANQSIGVGLFTQYNSNSITLMGSDIQALPCDGGDLQHWKYNATSNVLSLPKLSWCLDPLVAYNFIDYYYGTLQLDYCNDDLQHQWQLTANGQLISRYNSTPQCIGRAVDPVYPNLLELQNCNDTDEYQQWKFGANGSIFSVADGKCIAAGYLIQSIAFITPSNEIVVIVISLSENTIQIKLKDGNAAASLTIPAHSITTYSYPA